MTKDFVTHTAAGVIDVDQPSGVVTTVLLDGATVAQLEVNDGAGNLATVYLDYPMIAALMVSLGAVANEL